MEKRKAKNAEPSLEDNTGKALCILCSAAAHLLSASPQRQKTDIDMQPATSL